MLLKAKDLLGLKIVTLKSGEFIDTVKDIIFDPKSNKILGLLLSAGGWFSKAKVLLFEDIRSIGKDAVVVEDNGVIKEADDVQKRVSDIAQNDTYLTATRIVTEEGADLGKVSDIYFDPATGKVTEFEVSGGAMSDTREGRKRVSIGDIVTVGKDATIVKNYTVHSFEKQGQEGGLQGAMADLRDKGQEVMDNVKDKAEEIRNDPQTQTRLDEIRAKAEGFKETAQAKVEEFKAQAPKKAESIQKEAGQKSAVLQDKMTQQSLDNVAGQILTKTVYDPATNEVIGEAGATVDYVMLERAQAAGVLEQITGNVEPPLR